MPVHVFFGAEVTRSKELAAVSRVGSTGGLTLYGRRIARLFIKEVPV
jgi:hypothetical protein